MNEFESIIHVMSDTEGHTQCDSLYMTFEKSQNYRNRKQISDC